MVIKQSLKRVILFLIPKSIKAQLGKAVYSEIKVFSAPEFINLSYSQEGEDLILGRIFEGRYTGFYIDVGAHHPMRFSNTYKFYLLGWRGINIDALPDSMKKFKQARPDDINIEVPISKDTSSKLTYYMFNEPALNTFDKSLADSRNNGKPYKITEERIMQTYTLAEILKMHMAHGQKIDFLSIDVEGLDVEVLESNDWELYRPAYIVTECFDTSLSEVRKADVNGILESKGYSLFAKTVNSLIYKNEV